MITLKNISKQQKAKLISVLILTLLALKIGTQLQQFDNSIHHHKLFPKLHCKILLIDLHNYVFLPLDAQNYLHRKLLLPHINK